MIYYRKRRTPLGIIGVCLLVFGMISYQVGNFIWAVIAGVAALLVLGIEVWRFRNEFLSRREQEKATSDHQRKKAELFIVEYPSSPAHKFHILPHKQRLELTLQLSLETYIEFIAIQFQSRTGNPPVITGLDDPQRSPRLPYNVHTDSISNGTWYWNYLDNWHRLEGARITIGVTFVAKEPSSGLIFVKMTTRDGSKDKNMAYSVIKQ